MPYNHIHLNPGEFWFGHGRVRLHTLLGSCVAVVLWHERRRVGGMCHFMLPDRGAPDLAAPNAKYADEAFILFDRQIQRYSTHAKDYKAWLYGGGNMFPDLSGPASLNIGLRNIERARQLLSLRDIRTVSEHVGGHGHRKLVADIWSGTVLQVFQAVSASS